MAHLHALGRREFEQLPGAPISRHEHPDDVVVGRVAIEAGRAQPTEERLEVARRLDAQFVDTAPGLLQRFDRAGRGDSALVHDNDVIAGVLDVRKEV